VAPAFFQAWQRDVSFFFPARLLTNILSQARSANADVRSKTVDLFTVLVGSTFDAGSLSKTIDEVGSPLRLGKSASTDNRIALLSMLSTVPPSSTHSNSLIGIASTVLSKESNESAISSIFRLLSTHLPILLSSDIKLNATPISVVVKSLQDTKPATRRAASGALGHVFWTLDQEGVEANEAISGFAKALLPALEVNLKNVASNPLNSPAGPLEGYVAVTLLRGVFQRWQVVNICMCQTSCRMFHESVPEMPQSQPP
jgi:hypothetical protein